MTLLEFGVKPVGPNVAMFKIASEFEIKGLTKTTKGVKAIIE